MTRPSRENLVSALYDHPNLEAVAAHFGESIALVQSWCDVERLRVPKPVKRRPSFVPALLAIRCRTICMVAFLWTGCQPYRPPPLDPQS